MGETFAPERYFATKPAKVPLEAAPDPAGERAVQHAADRAPDDSSGIISCNTYYTLFFQPLALQLLPLRLLAHLKKFAP